MKTSNWKAPKPHIPDKLPLNIDKIINNDLDFFQLTMKANNALGNYNGFLQSLVNPMLLISPLLNQEAVVSSKLEGTHATLEDVLNYEAGNKVEIEQDEIQEIINYRQSLYYALDNLGPYNIADSNRLPLTSRIIKQMHSILLDNVRGATKRPGNFKIHQNFIGGKTGVSFTPLPPELTNEYMSNLENYFHYEEIDLIIQSAIIHTQFEMIHPFEDGNGRIGRLLIPLFLFYRGALKYPTFYMSSYFESNRTQYISRLDDISSNGNWIDWLKFYMLGVSESAESNTIKAQKIQSLYEHMKHEVIPKLNSTFGIELLDFIFLKPIFNASQVTEQLNVSSKTAYNLLNKLIETEFLSDNNAARNKTYFCPQLLSLI